MQKSKNHYLAKSRMVLQINDPEKLNKLLQGEKAELSRYLSAGQGNKPTLKNNSLIRNTKKNIARIKTRLNQLKQMEKNHV